MTKANQNFDAYIIGSGPNGLAAGIHLAQNGISVKIFEAKDTIGGGTRTKELTEPGFLHDVCSAVHPTALSSPFLKTLPLSDYGLEWIHPTIPLAHPFLDGNAFIAEKSIYETAARLGKDKKMYLNLFEDFVHNWDDLSEDVFGNLRTVNHPLSLLRFGWYGIFSSKLLAQSIFDKIETRTYFAGLAAHSILPLSKMFTAAFGIILGTSVHAVGWPIAKGGSQSITNAMAEYFKSLGGEIEVNSEITSLKQIPDNKVIMFDTSPAQMIEIAGETLPVKYLRRLADFKYGPGAFKMDFALSEAVPWENEECRKAGTLHLGANFYEIASSERAVWKGEHSANPYVLVSQPSLFDDTRAPKGKHTLWAYCHVPNNSKQDMSEEIISMIEKYAPGFRDTIISSSSMNAQDFQAYNSNYRGGDINAGAQYASQLLGRPIFKWDPYSTPIKGIYICSSSTPPGGGVHGMCGYNAAQSVMKNEFGEIG